MNGAPSRGNEWGEWSRQMFYEVKEIRDDQKLLTDKVNKLLVEIAVLKVKSSLWGTLGGALAVLIWQYLVGFVK